jgi:hypothetical protein
MPHLALPARHTARAPAGDTAGARAGAHRACARPVWPHPRGPLFFRGCQYRARARVLRGTSGSPCRAHLPSPCRAPAAHPQRARQPRPRAPSHRARVAPAVPPRGWHGACHARPHVAPPVPRGVWHGPCIACAVGLARLRVVVAPLVPRWGLPGARQPCHVRAPARSHRAPAPGLAVAPRVGLAAGLEPRYARARVCILATPAPGCVR